MIEVIDGNLLDSKEKYIAHQCNCVSQGASGVARVIFDKYPYSDVYKDRTEHDIMNTIKIMGNGIDQRYVINMFSQYYPGGVVYGDSDLDGFKAREKSFYRCLNLISKIDNLTSIAFPWKIGCGIAGGDWNYYLGVLNNFAKYVEEKQGTQVKLYRIEE